MCAGTRPGQAMEVPLGAGAWGMSDTVTQTHQVSRSPATFSELQAGYLSSPVAQEMAESGGVPREGLQRGGQMVVISQGERLPDGPRAASGVPNTWVR